MICHKGHRERLRKKFIKLGADSLEDHEILELLLFYVFTQKNTNDIAHDLINTFGSISAVFDAPFESLVKVNWVGEKSATLLKLIPEIARIYINDKHNNKSKIMNLTSIKGLAINSFIGRTEEHLLLILMDIKMKLLFCGMISNGSSTSTDVYIQNIIRLATDYGASKAVIAHNHPSGIALPSSSDIKTTKAIKKILDLINVRLIDHIIVADNDCTSMVETNLSEEIFKRKV